MQIVQDFKLVTYSPQPIVSMVIYKDKLFIATQKQVFELIDGILKPLMFVVPKEND